MLAVALSGGAFICAPAAAQDQGGGAGVEARIDEVFEIVPGNPLDLAVPLTRRALARRLGGGDANPLPDAPDEASAAAREPEEGSADTQREEDEDVARVPRPRPDSVQQASSRAEMAEVDATLEELPTNAGGAFELVAGAPAPAEPAPVAAPAPEKPAPTPQAFAAASPAALPTPHDIIADEDCLSPSDVADRDKDFERNKAALSAPGFCIAQEKFRERRRNWVAQTVDSGRPGPLWVVMHDDEDNSFDTAVWALTTYGGRLITLETGGRRNQDGVDPNRNFSDAEIGCRKLGDSATPRFSEAFKGLFDPARPVIALHNNDADRTPTGGLGHVSMNSVPGEMRATASKDPDGPLAGDYALVLLTASEPVEPAIENRVAALSGEGMNVVLESVREDGGDCSLSNYAVLSGHPNFINVTVHHDEAEKQRKIVAAVMTDMPAVSAAR